MNLQLLIVALLVALSFAYAAWTLMPQALRATLARRLLGLHLPGFMRQRLLAAANARVGYGCSGCDKAPSPSANSAPSSLPVQAQRMVFHPRKPK